MPTWIIIVILLSIAATALLASVLQRINAPPSRQTCKAESGGNGAFIAHVGGGRGGKHDSDSSDNAGDSGGDGGGGGD
jgi:hypothetical protein